MDVDVLKTAAAVFAGAMGLIGGILTFVNGRLKDAETSDEKFVIYYRTWQWISNGLSVVAVLLMFFFKTYLISVILFVAIFGIQSYLFLSLPNPVTRREIVAIGLLCSMLASGLVFMSLAPLLERVIEIQGSMVEIQKKTLDTLHSAPIGSSK